MQTVNKELAQKCAHYINSGLGGKLYTFTTFFTTTDALDSTVLRRGSSTFFRCPFHVDNTPSFGFDDIRLVYNCFSCGSGGTYLNFLFEYNKKVLGRNITFYRMLDELLKKDPIMQAKLGFQTIYYDGDTILNLKDFKLFKAKNLHQSDIPNSYLELADYCKKQNVSEKEKILFINLMQDGIPAKTIYKELFCSSDNNYDSFDNYDIGAILGGD